MQKEEGKHLHTHTHTQTDKQTNSLGNPEPDGHEPEVWCSERVGNAETTQATAPREESTQNNLGGCLKAKQNPKEDIRCKSWSFLQRGSLLLPTNPNTKETSRRKHSAGQGHEAQAWRLFTTPTTDRITGNRFPERATCLS